MWRPNSTRHGACCGWWLFTFFRRENAQFCAANIKRLHWSSLHRLARTIDRVPVTTVASFGVRSDQFWFSIIGTSNLVIVVEACTDLADPAWSPMGPTLSRTAHPTSVITSGPTAPRAFLPPPLMVRVILESGADRPWSNSLGDTAEPLARQHGSASIAALVKPGLQKSQQLPRMADQMSCP